MRLQVQSHIAQFYSLQQVFQLQQQLDRLERLLQLQEERRFSESQQWHAAKGITLQNQYRELLERQQRVGHGLPCVSVSMVPACILRFWLTVPISCPTGFSVGRNTHAIPITVVAPVSA